MFSTVSNVFRSSNADEKLPGHVHNRFDVLLDVVSRQYQIDCLSKDVLVDRGDAEATAIDDFDIKLADMPETVSASVKDKGGKTSVAISTASTVASTVASTAASTAAAGTAASTVASVATMTGKAGRIGMIGKRSGSMTTLLSGIHDNHYDCNTCDKRFASKHLLKQHEKVHNPDREHCCDVCKRVFLSRSGLSYHRKAWHSGENSFTCLYGSCLRSFRYLAGVREHLLRDHNRLETSESLMNVYDNMEKRNTDGSGYVRYCLECDAEFTDADRLRQHEIDKHNMTADYQCKYCDKGFSTVVCLEKHEVDCHRDKVSSRFTDGYCQKHVREDSTYEAHIVKSHPDQAKASEYKCHYCNEVFIGTRRFKNHLVNTHNDKNVSSVICHYCQKSFSVPSELRRHLVRIHPEKEKGDYVCSHCPATFTRPCDLARHKVIKHRDIEKGKLPCEYCDCSFLTNSEMKKHLVNKHPEKLNPDFKCKVCPQKFVSRTMLKYHESRVHSIKPEGGAICDLCGLVLAFPSGMKRHREAKHQENGFSCLYCSAVFTSRARLNVHNKDEHFG